MSKISKTQIKQNVRDWLAALESDDPNISQGVGQLFNGEGYCCLGVGCIATHTKIYTKKSSIDTIAFGTSKDWSTTALPNSVADKLGIRTPSGGFKEQSFMNHDYAAVETKYPTEVSSTYSNLASLNDDGRFTFKQIAAFIRTKPKGLFINGLWDEDEVI